MRAPVFIFGMHRSGTTLLVKLLHDLGLFAGDNWDPNAEPWYLLRRNEWILRRAGGAWDHPAATHEFLGNPIIRRALVEQLEADLDQRFSEFVSGGRRATELLGPWGAKDPRLSFTLDIWRELFPGCKVLLVRRNGVDVARSLVTRAQQELSRETPLCVRPLHKRFKAMWHPFEFLPHWSMPTRCFELGPAFALWEEYVEASEATFARFDGPKHAIAYEDLLESPNERMREIVAFCELEAPAADVDESTARIDPSRRLAFTADDAALAFYREVCGSRWMRELGYERLV